MFSPHAEAAGRGLLHELFRDLRHHLLECSGVDAAGDDCLPIDLEGSGEKGFFVSHDCFDLIFCGGDLGFNFLLHNENFKMECILYYLLEDRMKFVWETPEEINMALAQRLSKIRKRRDLSQQALSEKSNVSYGSIKRFETSGQISLISLTKLCVALDCVDEIKNLFTNVEYGSIEEVIRERS